MTDTDLSTWLTIAEAAKTIGASTRTIERLAHGRKLEQRLRPQAGSPPVAVYNPVDVARVASERAPARSPFVLPADPTGNANGRGDQIVSGASQGGSALALPAGDDPIRQLFAAALRAVLSPPSPTVAATVAEKSFLTIKEAAAVTGLTQAYLRRLIDDKTLPAIRDRGWRIRRRDLELL